MIEETDPSKEGTSPLKCALLESVYTAKFQGSTPERNQDKRLIEWGKERKGRRIYCVNKHTTAVP